MTESKVLVPAEWLAHIGRTWEGVYKVLGTWDDKLPESLEKGIYTNNIRSSQAISR